MKASEIVEQIEAILKERGIKKGDFYKACGISAAVVSNWRNNKNYPLFPTLQTINEYLGTSFVVSLNDDNSLPYGYQALLKAKAQEQQKSPSPWDGDGPDERLVRINALAQTLSDDQKDMLIAQLEILAKSQES